MTAPQRHTLSLTVAPWGSRTLHFHSTFAGRLGGTGNCVTTDAENILVQGDRVVQRTLAHEFGHGERAKRLGKWTYRGQIAWRFVLALDWRHPFRGGLMAWLQAAYVKSKAEREADEFENAYYQLFPSEVRCPDDNA